MIMQVPWKDSTSFEFLGLLLTSWFSSALYIKEIKLDGNTSNMEILPKTADLNIHLGSFTDIAKVTKEPKAYLPMPATLPF